MTLWLVAGDPDPLAGREERADHPRAGVGLARAGRPLDGQDRPVELQREPAGRVELRLAGPDERRPGRDPDPGRLAEEQVAGGASQARPGDAVVDDPFPELDEPGLVVPRPDPGGAVPAPVDAVRPTSRLRSIVRSATSTAMSAPTSHVKGLPSGSACLRAGS